MAVAKLWNDITLTWDKVLIGAQGPQGVPGPKGDSAEWHPVVCASTNGTFDPDNPPTTIGGYGPLTIGERVLLAPASGAAWSGIYVFQGVGVPMIRPGDADNGEDFFNGKRVYVQYGSFAGRTFRFVGDGQVFVGGGVGSPLPFVELPDLNVHKNSGDHDERYDSRYPRVTGVQGPPLIRVGSTGGAPVDSGGWAYYDITPFPIDFTTVVAVNNWKGTSGNPIRDAQTNGLGQFKVFEGVTPGGTVGVNYIAVGR